MERWAGSKLGEKAHFLCVCVDPSAERVAKKFVKELNLQHCIVGYCASQEEFPTFPAQLGCGGLVIFDADGRIAMGKTQSLNEIGLPAFWNADHAIVALCDEDDEEDDAEDAQRRVYRDMNQLRYDVMNGGARPCQVPRDPNAGKEERQKKEEAAKSLGSVPSVGHDEMDHEHEECTKLIQKIEKEKSIRAFEDLLTELVEHFAHEENLLKEKGFGSNAPSALSPLITHTQDHKRIIMVVGQMLERAKQRGVWDSCAHELANIFETHATQFDARYEEYLATF
mmetsp:Transcript_12719/g.25919  ORF Transcript_12719/g.25919 Transcript_12719/m.25919 type:complete len:282 (+) Transcript_12719:234-1079(+)